MKTTTLAHTPPEWAPQSAVWVGWPHLRDAWAEDYEGAQREIAALVKALAPVVTVKLVIGAPHSRPEAVNLIGDLAELYDAPMGDIWLRDIGPVFVKFRNRLEGLGFTFNGWGGKYELEGDTETAAAIARLEGHPLKRLDFVLVASTHGLHPTFRVKLTAQRFFEPRHLQPRLFEQLLVGLPGFGGLLQLDVFERDEAVHKAHETPEP